LSGDQETSRNKLRSYNGVSSLMDYLGLMKHQPDQPSFSSVVALIVLAPA